jgi:hypothetical protein
MDDNSLKEFIDELIFNGKLNLIYTINDMYVLADVYNKGTNSDFETPVKAIILGYIILDGERIIGKTIYMQIRDVSVHPDMRKELFDHIKQVKGIHFLIPDHIDDTNARIWYGQLVDENTNTNTYKPEALAWKNHTSDDWHVLDKLITEKCTC